MVLKNPVVSGLLEKILISKTIGKSAKNHNRKILFGLFFIGASLIVPLAIQTQINSLLEDIRQSVLTGDTGLLLLAATKLVFFNTIRHAPVITGAFLIGEGLSSIFKYNRFVFFLSLLIIPFVFKAISAIYNIQFLFTGSIYVTVSVILVLFFLTTKIPRTIIKLFIINLFLFGFDWLEIVPMLEKFGYSGGEIAKSIIMVSGFIGADYILNYVGFTISLMIIINALILTKVIIDHYNRMFLIEKLRKTEIEALHSRYFQEVKHLVHDLKTPLFTIHGLNGAIKMMVENPKVKTYNDVIANSVENISSMISEILHERKLSVIDVKEITDFLKTHLSLEENQEKVKIKLLTEKKIHANKYLLSRALINIINNSLQAIDPEIGLVQLNVDEENGMVLFSVMDNGRGISKENLEKIWELGYSSGKSTGLGLNFVKKVVNNHRGDIEIQSKPKQGTTVKIYLPKVDLNDEKIASG